MTVTVLSVSENNFRMHDLPVARTQTGHGITWGQLERQAVHLGKRFRLMAPQDHVCDSPWSASNPPEHWRSLGERVAGQPQDALSYLVALDL